ncbi:hypothetical protein Kpol_259p3 [Vanderwaltozyma polyspora DSM 70294]|uniref:RanBD1 domain-containing protein n=1 Tax=Vanderwaltozyma polyspora (strain ATCC 22028 / DSM 70294 / BCRC 21397 / CBS 2163 / NBRC 10782 / NRRL Y-8283 / UCD 57-17) TaxID=436907 RepID=A7TT66_VANPO|nr:uncharacterized protein Kpol_259p3 [Vanderwaltozyma polyspora DSM 70294]EDO14540.1 hypothetical protein Kpol_259p3 [Vanderwaltozyma polyspora DSM 70294]
MSENVGKVEKETVADTEASLEMNENITSKRIRDNEEGSNLEDKHSSDDENNRKKLKTESGGDLAKDTIVATNEKITKDDKHSNVSTEESDKTSKPAIEEKPKFVFGASSAFSSSFGVANKNNSNNSVTSNQNKSETAEPVKPFSFGSGLSFGGGFNVLKKKDEVTKEEKDSEDKDDQEESKNQEESSLNEESKTENGMVKLEKQDVKSGEELEDCIYQVNTKLYQLTDIKSGWKERGVGIIKINKNKETGKTRLVMRSRGLLKVILNLPLLKEFTLYSGFPGSLQSEKFVRILAMDDNKKPVQYAFKTGKEETALELYDNIKTEIPE